MIVRDISFYRHEMEGYRDRKTGLWVMITKRPCYTKRVKERD